MPSSPYFIARLIFLGALFFSGFVLRAATFDLTTATVADINSAFNAGALTSEKLTALYLARIKAYDQEGPKLNTSSPSIRTRSTTPARSTRSGRRKARAVRCTAFRCW